MLYLASVHGSWVLLGCLQPGGTGGMADNPLRAGETVNRAVTVLAVL